MVSDGADYRSQILAAYSAGVAHDVNETGEAALVHVREAGNVVADPCKVCHTRVSNARRIMFEH